VGTSGGRWATLADAIHLLAAAAWTGALAHLVLVLAAAAALGSAASVPVRRYAELALPTVLVVLGTGSSRPSRSFGTSPPCSRRAMAGRSS
jgi:putative copper export protein